jgi:hypothetical protein
MARLARFFCISVLLFSSITTTALAEDAVNKDTDPEPLVKIEDKIPQANRKLVSSYRELSPSYWEETPLPVRGLAMYYNPGIMERVLRNRVGWGHLTECEECIGRVALLRDGDIDRKIWLQRPGYPVEGPFWVIDQAARHDVPGLVRRNWTVDVDYQTAMRWRMRGPIPIVVLEDPSQALPVDRLANTSAMTPAMP